MSPGSKKAKKAAAQVKAAAPAKAAAKAAAYAPAGSGPVSGPDPEPVRGLKILIESLMRSGFKEDSKEVQAIKEQIAKFK